MQANLLHLYEAVTRALLAAGSSEEVISRVRAALGETLDEPGMDSQMRKAASFDAALDCIITMDHQGRIRELNSAAERTFGYTLADVIGRTVGEVLCPPRFRSAHTQGLARHLATGESRILGNRVEVEALRADGSELPVELVVVRTAAEPPLFVAHLRDITERRRQVAQRLGRQTALLALGGRISRDLEEGVREVLRTDAEQLGVERVSYWSRSHSPSALVCEELYVASADTWQRGERLEEADAPLYFAAIEAHPVIVADDAQADERTREFRDPYFRSKGITSTLDVPVWREGRLAGVICHEHVGPPRRWSLEDRDFAISIGNVVSMMISADERTRSEEALRKSEERYRLVAKATSDVIWDWDLRTGEVLWSDAVGRAFGHELGSIEPTFAWWSARLHPEDSLRVEASMRAAIDGGQSSWSDEHRFQRSDGEYAMVLDRGFVARDDDGRAVRMVGTMLDITARKKLEVQLLRADRLAAVGTLAAGVAHEINNPLAYIAGNVGYVREQLARMREPFAAAVEAGGPAAARRRAVDEVCDALSEAYEGAGRIRQIVRDLKLFARGDDGGSGPSDVHRVLESSINMANNEIRHRALLVRDYRPVPPVEGSDSRLGQVFLNLLINAAHAIKEGSVSTNEIRVGTDVDGEGRVVVTVQDSGAGMPAEVMSRIFDPFFTTKPVGIGTGLGLSICHGIITDLGGEISVDSAPARGTVFTVVLPVHHPRLDPEPRAAAPSSRPTSAPFRILVIDDEPSLGRALTRMLAHEHEVVVVQSGREGLARLLEEDEWFDPVLCDLMMPDMSGIELYEELLETRPHIAERIIFMTGGAFTPRAREFLERVPNIRLEKPFDLETLREAVRRRLM